MNKFDMNKFNTFETNSKALKKLELRTPKIAIAILGAASKIRGESCTRVEIIRMLFTGSPGLVKMVWKEETRMENKEIIEENRKLRFLRYLVDFSLLSIQQEELTLEQALKVIEDVKQAACNLFPGKEETFELIYRPRFLRVIQERFGTTSFIS